MLRCHDCLAVLMPGTEVCPCCEAAIAPAKPRRKKRTQSRFNAIELLWVFTAIVIVFGVVLQTYSHYASGRSSAPLAGGTLPASGAPALEIWAVLQQQYPDLNRFHTEPTGVRQVAVPEKLWNSLHDGEKKRFAHELDTLIPTQSWVILTGPYLGDGRIAARRPYSRSEIFNDGELDPASPSAEGVVAAAKSVSFSEQQPPIAQQSPSVRIDAAREVPDELMTPRLPAEIPDYVVLFRTDNPTDKRVFGEVLVPTLSPQTPNKERRRIARAVAAFEGLDDLTLYCTRQAHEAHYSMEFSSLHPDALDEGLLGRLERGRFKPHKPDG